MLRKILFTGAALLIALTSSVAISQQRSTFDIALTVNDVPITWYDIDQRVRLLRFNGAPSSENLQNIAVEQLVEDRLKREAAERIGIRPQGNVDAELISAFAQSTNRSVDSIERGLSSVGASRASLAEALKADALWREVIRTRFGSRAEPSESDLDQAIALAAAGRNREFRLSELVIPVAARGEAATQRFAEQLSRDLNAGGNFAAAARRESASPSAPAGGSIGWVSEGALPPTIVAAIEDLRVGGVTRPIPVPGAIVLLKLEEERLVRIDGAGLVEMGIVALSAMDRDPIAAVARLDAVITQAPSCDTVEQVVRGTGVTVARAEPRPLPNYPEQVRGAIANLQQGAISAPVTVQGGAAAFIVCERSEGVSNAARDELRDQMRQDRFVRFSNSYLQELRADAIIERR